MSLFQFIRDKDVKDEESPLNFELLFEFLYELKIYSLKLPMKKVFEIYMKYCDEETKNIFFEEFVPMMKEILQNLYEDPNA